MYMEAFVIFLSLILPVSMDNIKANQETIVKKIQDAICYSLGLCVLIAIKLYQSPWSSNMFVEELECSKPSPLTIADACFIRMTIIWDHCLSSFISLRSFFITITLFFCSVSWITILLPCRQAVTANKKAIMVLKHQFHVVSHRCWRRRNQERYDGSQASASLAKNSFQPPPNLLKDTRELEQFFIKVCLSENRVFFCTFMYFWTFVLCYIA